MKVPATEKNRHIYEAFVQVAIAIAEREATGHETSDIKRLHDPMQKSGS